MLITIDIWETMMNKRNNFPALFNLHSVGKTQVNKEYNQQFG